MKTAENLEVMAGIPVERIMIETDSPYCEIKNTHAGIKHVKTTWPSKKKEKHDIESLVKGRCEPCQIRCTCDPFPEHIIAGQHFFVVALAR